jgi:hypothetical protein
VSARDTSAAPSEPILVCVASRKCRTSARSWDATLARLAQDVSNKADFVGLSPRLLSIGLSP